MIIKGEIRHYAVWQNEIRSCPGLHVFFLISEAKNLLTGGDQSVSEIAYALGFENPPYFSKLFKKEVGVTPNEFRFKLTGN